MTISNFSAFSDASHEISYLIFFRKLGKMLQNLSSAAVVIGPLRVKDKIMFKDSIQYGPQRDKTCLGFLTNLDSNKSSQLQRLARILTIHLKQVKI